MWVPRVSLRPSSPPLVFVPSRSSKSEARAHYTGCRAWPGRRNVTVMSIRGEGEVRTSPGGKIVAFRPKRQGAGFPSSDNREKRRLPPENRCAQSPSSPGVFPAPVTPRKVLQTSLARWLRSLGKSESCIAAVDARVGMVAKAGLHEKARARALRRVALTIEKGVSF